MCRLALRRYRSVISWPCRALNYPEFRSSIFGLTRTYLPPSYSRLHGKIPQQPRHQYATFLFWEQGVWMKRCNPWSECEGGGVNPKVRSLTEWRISNRHNAKNLFCRHKEKRPALFKRIGWWQEIRIRPQACGCNSSLFLKAFEIAMFLFKFENSSHFLLILLPCFFEELSVSRNPARGILNCCEFSKNQSFKDPHSLPGHFRALGTWELILDTSANRQGITSLHGLPHNHSPVLEGLIKEQMVLSEVLLWQEENWWETKPKLESRNGYFYLQRSSHHHWHWLIFSHMSCTHIMDCWDSGPYLPNTQKQISQLIQLLFSSPLPCNPQRSLWEWEK